MTIQGLYKDVIHRPEFDLVDMEPMHHMKDISGSWVAIDAYILLYKALHRINVCRQFHTKPKVPVTNVIKILRGWHKSMFKDNGVHAIYVFDGCRHSLKARIDGIRAAKREKLERRVQELHKDAREQDRSEVEKTWQQLVYPRGDVILEIINWLKDENIPFMQCPFEAEAQCVKLQKDGLVQYVLSDDGDVFSLGATKWITCVHPESGKCCILDSADICKRESAGGGRWNEFLSIIPAFRGCDYNVKPYRLDFKKEMDGYASSEDKHEFLLGLENRYKWPPKAAGEALALLPAVGFAADAEHTKNMFDAHPVWSFKAANAGGTIDLNDSSTYMVDSLVPINGDNHYMQDSDLWGREIGFGASPVSVLEANGIPFGKYNDMRTGILWGRSGRPLAEELIQHQCYDNRYLVEHGTLVNFDPMHGGIPPEHYCDEILFFFLRANRSLRPSHSGRHRPLRFELVNETKRLLEVRSRPGIRGPRPKALSEIRKESGTFSMDQILCPRNGGTLDFRSVDVMRSVRSLLPITDKVINEVIFGKRRNGVRYRACRRLDGGHYDIDTFGCAEVEFKENNEPGLLFRILVTPSQKADPYWSYFVYDKNGQFCEYPASRCECPIVRGCSHSLGWFGIFHLIQENKSWTLSDLKAACPPPVKSLQSLPVPWVAGQFRPDRRENEAKAAGTARLEFLEVHGERERDNEDEVTECAAQDEEDTGAPLILICAYAQKMVAEAEKRAEVTESELEFVHRVTLESLREANKAKLNGVGGPNESLIYKQEQLEMHERLHQAVEKGELPKTLLSHYAFLSRPMRKRLLAQIGHVQDDQVIRKKSRLLKIDGDDAVAGDKAFNNCAALYGNYNGQECPHHLIGGTFETEEIERDEPLCTLRYTSETFNSRVTDVTCLQDRVPRTFFPHLDDAVNWGQGRGNLYEPFYLPAECSYFDYLKMKKAQAKKEQLERKKRRVERKRKALETIARTAVSICLALSLPGIMYSYYSSR